MEDHENNVINQEILKLELVKALNEFDHYCKANNLKYSLAYGTALGAVRHHGFIPWDDDIDVMMPRSDYEKLEKIYQHDIYDFYTQKRHQPYAYAYGKLVNTNTRLIERNVKEKYELGVYIDIFPVDFYVKSAEKEIFKNARKIENALHFIALKFTFRNINIRLCLKYLVIILLRVFLFISRNTPMILVEKLEKYLKKFYNDSEDMKVIVGGSENECDFKDSDFDSLIPIDFEEKTFMILKDYDRYLKNVYGDYMKLPPKSKRVSNHNFDAFWK